MMMSQWGLVTREYAGIVSSVIVYMFPRGCMWLLAYEMRALTREEREELMCIFKAPESLAVEDMLAYMNVKGGWNL